MSSEIEVLGGLTPRYEEVLSQGAMAFVAELTREFEPRRRELMEARAVRQAGIDAGRFPDFLPETAEIRERNWRVASAPEDLLDRRVEITGPCSDRKMVINALNSGAQVYMSDLEDSHSPGWSQTIEGLINLRDASRGDIAFTDPNGIEYSLKDVTATLTVRPRGLHLVERHVLVDGEPISASIFDFGLYLFHNADVLIKKGSGPYVYLPKLQAHQEARLWNDIFLRSQELLGLTPGTIRATALIEHILAAFEMEEVLYELRDHITGLNLGRWDYIFSFIKTFRRGDGMTFPDRAQVTMATDFLRSAAELLVQTCHKRGAHALGGMSAFIPRRDDPEANERAFAQVRGDKEREASQGFDGAWVAHPGLAPPVLEVFQAAFQGPNQLNYVPEVRVTARDLLQVPPGEITEAGLRNNISVALRYITTWIQGRGAVPIYALMEDTATAEISRAQLWQWIWHGAKFATGEAVTKDNYRKVRTEESAKLLEARGAEPRDAMDKAAELLDELVTSPEFADFLTIQGYKYLE